jgi:hypothetical protein
MNLIKKITVHVQVNKTWCPTTSWSRDSALTECYSEHLTIQVISSTSADATVSLTVQQQGVIVVKEAKNYQRQEPAPPSGTGGCQFSTFWGLQQK